MTKDSAKKGLKGLGERIKAAALRLKPRRRRLNTDADDSEVYRSRRHYRLELVNENKFTRLWSLRMTRGAMAAYLLSAVVAIGIILCILFVYTPLGRILPGHLSRDTREDYIDMALKLDSLERRAHAISVYAETVRSILNGHSADDPRAAKSDTEAPVTLPVDSLTATSEAERNFVQRYESERAYNLSVLTPIAAQGMTFVAPVSPGPDGIVSSESSVGISVPLATTTGVSSIYRGTVVAAQKDQWGRYTVAVQHPNDFLSVYSGLDDAFVSKGDRVAAGQRLGHVAAGGNLWLELWHNGSALPMDEYIPF